MISQEKVYFRLPAIGQNILLSTIGVRVNKARYGSLFRRHFAAYCDRDRWDPERMAEFRRGRRARILELASYTPYYERLFRELGADWRDFVTDDAFAELPMTHKSDIREWPEEFRTRAAVKGDSVVRTSGTTGSSISVFKDANAVAEQWAVWWRYRQWHGLTHDTWCAIFVGRRVIAEAQGRPYWRMNHPGREIRFSSYHISPETVGAYVEKLNRTRVPWIHGFASAIGNLATCMVERGVEIDYRISAITLGGENLAPWQLKNIQRAFGITPKEHYGLAEQAANISTCPEGNLHVDEDFAEVEFVEQEHGSLQIVGTPYANEAMILLRYATGDLATLGAGRCGCGRTRQLVASIDGRKDDVIRLPDGRVLGTPEDAFRPALGLAEAQVVQHADGDLTVRYVPSATWSDRSLVELDRSFRNFVGQSVRVRYVQVNEVQRTPAGKVRLVISERAAGTKSVLENTAHN